MSMTRLLLVTLLLAVPALSCAGEPEEDPATSDTTPDWPPLPANVGDLPKGHPTPDAPDTATWTVGMTAAPESVGAPPMPVLTALRTGTHPNHERMTVEIRTAASGPPGYRVEYIDRPLTECGSGNQIFPVGDAWLELRLEPAAAHTEAGRPTLGAREIAVQGPMLLRIYRTCDFEGVVSLVMALRSPNPYRVLTLPDPWRIVVDVER